jgi:glycosyltransferase involved in cell wall biosynthesis
MWQFIVGCLRRKGLEPVLAFYQPYSMAPRLSVPSFALLSRRPGCDETPVEGIESHAIGAWLPELEFTDYLATKHWKQVMASCEFHVGVVGCCLQVLPFASSGTPFLAWVATPWESDRAERALELPILRRALDRVIVRPAARRMERRVLRSGRFLALSGYTGRELDRIAGRPVVSNILPMPIDSDLFSPRPERVEPGLVGFVGRFDDARKNVGHFLQSMAALRRTGAQVRGILIGGKPTETLLKQVRELGLQDSLQFLDFLPRAEVASLLPRIDVFVIPSLQEGLCIAGLEAMAAGCPVVSTRCGGPEEYVLDGETGYLTDFDAEEIAKAVGSIVADRPLRDRLAAGARRLIEAKYSFAAAEALFWAEFDKTFARKKICLQS